VLFDAGAIIPDREGVMLGRRHAKLSQIGICSCAVSRLYVTGRAVDTQDLLKKISPSHQVISLFNSVLNSLTQ